MLAGSGLTCFAQGDTIQIKQNVLRYADSSAIAFKNRDWKTLARFTAPSVVEIMGGVENFESVTQSFMKDVPDSAIKYIRIGPVTQLVKTNSDWQSIVLQHMQMELSGIRFTSTTPLIGQSLDEGKTWTFFDSKGDTATARLMLPDISPLLVLPKKVQDMQTLEKPKKTPVKPVAKPMKKNSGVKPAAKKVPSKKR